MIDPPLGAGLCTIGRPRQFRLLWIPRLAILDSITAGTMPMALGTFASDSTPVIRNNHTSNSDEVLFPRGMQ